MAVSVAVCFSKSSGISLSQGSGSRPGRTGAPREPPALRGEQRQPEAARERFAPSCGTTQGPESEEQTLKNTPLGVWGVFSSSFPFL